MGFDKNGWLSSTEAKKVKSPNFTSGNYDRQVIIMHYTAGYTASSAVNHFKKNSSKVSAHFVVGVDGDVTQMVSVKNKAWHAGRSKFKGRSNVNNFSIGIEIVNPGFLESDGNGGFIDGYGRKVSSSKMAMFGPVVHQRDSRLATNQCYWPGYPAGQLSSVEKLTKKLLSKFPSITDIASHREIDTRGWKTDPGPAFPMPRFKLLADDRRDPKPQALKVFVESGALNVRGGPGVGYDRLNWGPLENETFVDTIDDVGEWYKIVRWIDGKKFVGWVHGAYLVPR